MCAATVSGMDKGDLATWVSAGIALCVSVAALIVSVKALRWQRAGAEIAKRAQEFIEERHAEDRAKAEEEAGRVRWSLERPSQTQFVLRNITDNPVTGLTVDEQQFDGNARDVPVGVDVPPHGSVELRIVPSMQAPMPHEVWVEWDGGGPVAVPLPPWN